MLSDVNTMITNAASTQIKGRRASFILSNFDMFSDNQTAVLSQISFFS